MRARSACAWASQAAWAAARSASSDGAGSDLVSTFQTATLCVPGLMVRDARRCRAPHHEGRTSRLAQTPHPEEPRLRGVSKGGPRDSWSHNSAFPRHGSRPSCCTDHPRKTEGAGNAGCLAAPAASCAKGKHTRNSLQAKPKHRHSLRDGVNAYLRALPGVHDLLVTVACEIITRRLGTSPGVPGPHDFAVRISRARRTRCRVHRIPPLMS